MTYIFNPTMATPLCEIMGRNKSDKGHINLSSSKHNYTTFYYSIFNPIRMDTLRVFELGLGTNNVHLPSSMGANGRPGASLFGWNEFFPNSMIFGADIDKDILFQTEKIKTFYCDQLNVDAIVQMWNEPVLAQPFDIIIEDGLHEYKANVCFFENSIHKLAVNGYYIIEDVKTNMLPAWHAKVKEWSTKYSNLVFDVLPIPIDSKLNWYDNNLIVIRRLA